MYLQSSAADPADVSVSTARPDETEEADFVMAGATRVDDRLDADNAALALTRESLSAMRSCGPP